jgi:hypothetical protein
MILRVRNVRPNFEEFVDDNEDAGDEYYMILHLLAKESGLD